MVKGNNHGGRGSMHQKKSGKVTKESIANVYSHKDVDLETSNPDKFQRKYGKVDVYEYEMPSDFEDEEISEVEAFNSDDEQKYENLNVVAKNKKNKHKQKEELVVAAAAGNEYEYNLGVEEGDEDLMDLSEMLSGNNNSNNINTNEKTTSKDDDIMTNKYADFRDSEDDHDDSDFQEVDVRHEQILENLGINSIPQHTSRSNNVQDRSEVVEENEYSLSSRNAKNILDINDMMEGLGDEQSEGIGGGNYGGLKKLMENIQKGGDKIDTRARLNKRARKRVDRTVAYKETSESVSSWNDTVKANREAFNLSFPLNESLPQAYSSKELVAKFEAETELEKDVQETLKDAALDDEKSLYKGEKLQLQDIDIKEVRERQKQLKKMRALMSYYEQKRARIKKIKSKSYHRHLAAKKKADERNKKIQLGDGDDDTNNQEIQKELEEAEKKRAEERMTLRHKNTSKWAKHMLQRRNHLDENTKAALSEQLRLGNDLRQKITLDGFSDSDNIDDDIGMLQSELESSKDVNKESGLYSMKFMQRGMEKKRNAALEELENLKQELYEMEQEDEENNNCDSDDSKKVVEKSKNKVKELKGKSKLSEGMFTTEGLSMKSGFTSQVSGHVSIVADKDDIDGGGLDLNSNQNNNMDNGNGTNLNTGKVRHQAKTALKNTSATSTTSTTSASTTTTSNISDNPWLDVGNASEGDDDDYNDGEVSNDDSNSKQCDTKTDCLEENDDSHKISAQIVNGEATQQEIDTNTKSNPNSNSTTINDQQKDKEEAEENFNLNTISDVQKSLIKRAFANDNVVEEFEKEKQALINDMKPKEELQLEGWGSWGGVGVKPKAKKNNKKQQQKKAEVVENKRKDKIHKHVIINEKKDKKVAALLMKNLPHPYSDRSQYENAIRNPLGKEWNTPKSLQLNLKSKVSVKKGSYISPMGMTKTVKRKKQDNLNKQENSNKNNKRTKITSY